MEPHLVVFAKHPDKSVWANEYRNGWSGWEPWGGGAQFSPTACSWGGERIDVFVCGLDNALWHRWRDEDRVLHEWERLGGELSDAPAATAQMATGRIDVFVRAPDLTLWVNTLTDGNTDAAKWSGWQPWGGIFRSSPAACSRPGYVEVFGQGDDDDLWHTWTGVSGWHKLPPPLPSLTAGSRPACVAWGSGNVTVFARGGDSSDLLARDWLFNPLKGGAFASWHSWGGVLFSAPDACSPGGKRVDVVVRGDDGAIWHMYRGDAEFDTVTEMESLDGPPDADSWESGPAIVAMVPEGPIVAPAEIEWERATNWSGIEIDAAQSAFHAGRVIDVLRTRGRQLLAATAHSGVWHMDAGATAIPLSEDWDNPNTTCLAQGPDGDAHVFAGCGNANINSRLSDFGGALYETDPDTQFSLAKPWRRIPIPDATGSITDVLVLSARRIIVVACWRGLYWSAIPSAGGTYDWKSVFWSDVVGTPPAVYSVAAGPGGRIIAGAWDRNTPGRRGIYVGEWSDIVGAPPISMRRASIKSFSPADMVRVSVGASEAAPLRVYALSTDGSGSPNAVLRSLDGGLTWTPCTNAVVGAPDAYPRFIGVGSDASGGVMHQLGVSAVDGKAVGFGFLWPFGSFDGGDTWQLLEPWDGNDPERTHTHDDIHVVYFDPSSPGRTYIGSDGGLVRTEDRGKTFSSEHNRSLNNLQFYSTYTRVFFGRLSVNPQVPHLVGGGLQDNGNVYALLGTTPWRKVVRHGGTSEGGDGGQVVSLENGWLARSFMNDPIPRQTSWDATKQVLVDHGPIPVRSRDDKPLADSLAGAVMESTRAPIVKNALGERMYAVGAAETGETTANAYGLFAETSGMHMHWEPIIDPDWTIAPGSQVSAIGVGDGAWVLIALWGKAGIQVIRFIPSNGSWASVGGGLPTLPAGGFISRLLVREGSNVAFAVHNIAPSSLEPFGEGRLLRTDNGGMEWHVVPGLPGGNIYGLDEDWTASVPVVYAATDAKVLKSKDDGLTWSPASAGLPARPHCSDLRFVAYPGGKRYLYLGTWGWSLWRTELP